MSYHRARANATPCLTSWFAGEYGDRLLNAGRGH
jgi:hypothetical protein